MRAEARVTIDATVVVSLTEEEARVLAHLCGYNPELILIEVTRTYPVETLRRVAAGARMTLESAVRRIDTARKALRGAAADT